MDSQISLHAESIADVDQGNNPLTFERQGVFRDSLPRSTKGPLLAQQVYEKNNMNHVFIGEQDYMIRLDDRTRRLNQLNKIYHLEHSPSNRIGYLNLGENRLGKSRGDELRIPG